MRAAALPLLLFPKTPPTGTESARFSLTSAVQPEHGGSTPARGRGTRRLRMRAGYSRQPQRPHPSAAELDNYRSTPGIPRSCPSSRRRLPALPKRARPRVRHSLSRHATNAPPLSIRRDRRGFPFSHRFASGFSRKTRKCLILTVSHRRQLSVTAPRHSGINPWC